MIKWVTSLFVKKEPFIPDYYLLAKEMEISIERFAELAKLRRYFYQHIARYREVSGRCNNFPTDLIFALHYRETALDFSRCLHNGDKLPGPTTHVPKGRGPFGTWEDAAYDALSLREGLFTANWTLENKLIFAEKYNGLGYRKRGGLSPYVFSGTNLGTPGKFSADGKFDAKLIDKQIGVAAILLELKKGAKV